VIILLRYDRHCTWYVHRIQCIAIRLECITLFFLFQDSPRSQSHIYSHASLPRNARIAIPPDVQSPVHSPYHPQPIISRISIPPTSTQSRQHKPIPLSVIMRLQNPHWGANQTCHPRVVGADGDMAPYQPPVPFPREFFHQYVPQPLQHPPELRQPAVYTDGTTHSTSAHTLWLSVFTGSLFELLCLTTVVWFLSLQRWTRGISTQSWSSWTLFITCLWSRRIPETQRAKWRVHPELPGPSAPPDYSRCWPPRPKDRRFLTWRSCSAWGQRSHGPWRDGALWISHSLWRVPPTTSPTSTRILSTSSFTGRPTARGGSTVARPAAPQKERTLLCLPLLYLHPQCILNSE